MPDHPALTRKILRHVRNERVPGAPCVEFDTSTHIGGHDPERVLRCVEQLREEGLLEVIDVETDAQEQPVVIEVRGVTPAGEQFLDAS